jgi:hypothetical protein
MRAAPARPRSPSHPAANTPAPRYPEPRSVAACSSGARAVAAVWALLALLAAIGCGNSPALDPAADGGGMSGTVAAPPRGTAGGRASPAADGGGGAGAGADLQPESYAAVVDILQRSCTYVRCHSGTPVGGALDLTRGSDYAAALIGVPACEYERMHRVEPYDPEHSWLLLKLTASFRPSGDPYANYIYFEPEPDWDPDQRGCPDRTDSGEPLFGSRMPLTAPNMLPESELATIRNWILEGAPHRSP